MKIAICEDDIKTQSLLESYLEEYPAAFWKAIWKNIRQTWSGKFFLPGKNCWPI